MEDNPFVSMVSSIGKISDSNKSPSWCVAQVASVSPFVVHYSGKPFKPSLINCRLLYEIKTGFEDQVRAGDTVVMLQSQDGQDFVVLCKAVGG